MIDWLYIIGNSWFYIFLMGIILLGIGMLLFKFGSTGLGFIIALIGGVIIILMGYKFWGYVNRVGFYTFINVIKGVLI